MTTTGFVRSPSLSLATLRTTLTSLTLAASLATSLAALTGHLVPAGILLGIDAGLSYWSSRGSLRGAGVTSAGIALALFGVLATLLGEVADFFSTAGFRWTPLLAGIALAAAWWLGSRLDGALALWQKISLAVVALLAVSPLVGLATSTRFDLVVLGLASASVALGQYTPGPRRALRTARA